MRLFIGLELAPPLQRQVMVLIRNLRRLQGKWVEQSNLHLTLVFIGEIPETKVTALTLALTKNTARLPEFELKSDSLIGLPAKYPRLLAFAFQPNKTYQQLQQTVVACLKHQGLPAKAHAPHLTLVRLKPQPLTKIPLLAPFKLTIPVKEISLMQSTLTPKGPTYKRLTALKLASSGLSRPLRPNIAICLINPKNEVLLIRSPEHKPKDWQFPQGGIEPEESIEAAARRELKEEVGISHCLTLTLLERIYHYRWPKRLIARQQGHSQQGFIGQEQSLAIMEIKEERPRLQLNPREAAEFKWVPYETLLKAISPVRRGLAKIAMVELRRLIKP